MRKKIAILGSTGSIGKFTLDIIRKDKKNFDIVLALAGDSTIIKFFTIYIAFIFLTIKIVT